MPLFLEQSEQGYRYSIDPFLLCSFARVKNRDRVLDLGCGNGIILLLLAKKYAEAQFKGIEIQESLASLAKKNVQRNALEERIEIVCADLRKCREFLKASSFDVVVANPPYRHTAMGRISPVEERRRARHETSGGIDDFVRAAEALLKSKGRLFVVFTADRLVEILKIMSGIHLEPKRVRLVHSRVDEAARIVLIEACKGGSQGMKVDPPLIIYKGAGRDYSEELLRMQEMGLFSTPDKL